MKILEGFEETTIDRKKAKAKRKAALRKRRAKGTTGWKMFWKLLKW